MCDLVNRTLDETKPPLYNESTKEVFSMKSLFEQLGSTYTQRDVFPAEFSIPTEEEYPYRR